MSTDRRTREQRDLQRRARELAEVRGASYQRALRDLTTEREWIVFFYDIDDPTRGSHSVPPHYPGVERAFQIRVRAITDVEAVVAARDELVRVGQEGQLTLLDAMVTMTKTVEAEGIYLSPGDRSIAVGLIDFGHLAAPAESLAHLELRLHDLAMLLVSYEESGWTVPASSERRVLYLTPPSDFSF